MAEAAPAKHAEGGRFRVRIALRGPTATTTATNIVILGGNALTGIISARLLGPAGRGQLAIVVIWTALVNMVGIVGLPSSCAYHVARWPDRRASLAVLFRRIAARQAILMTIASALILWWLHDHLGIPPLLAAEYATWAAGTGYLLYGACYAQGLGKFRQFNIIRVIPGAGAAVLMVLADVSVTLTPAEAGAAYLLPVWCSALAAWFLLRRESAGPGIRRLAGRDRRSIRSYGWRSLASLSGLAVNRSADQIMLGLLVPASSLGLYSVAASASSPLPSLVASVGMVGLPTVAALEGTAKVPATWRALGRTTCLLALLSPLVAVVLPRLIPLIYGPHYAAAVLPAELLLLGTAFTALSSVADDLLRAWGHPGFVSVAQGAGGLITVVGTLLLARHSLAAVALVSSVGFVIALGLAVLRLWMLSRRVHRAARP